jgi:hypothetical protein
LSSTTRIAAWSILWLSLDVGADSKPIFSHQRRHRVLQWIASYADTIHNESALRARAAWARARQ